MRTIKITGTGQLKVHPDITVLTMALEGICPEYRIAAETIASQTDILKKNLSQSGIDNKDIKTLKFYVQTNFERAEHKGKYYKALTGYKYFHRLMVKFNSDNSRLTQILSNLANCDVKPDIDISYSINDKESAKNILLANAVKNSKDRAAALTEAAGVKLMDIQSIDYSWGEVDFNVRSVAYAGASTLESINAIDIEPEDITLTENVTITWEIE